MLREFPQTFDSFVVIGAEVLPLKVEVLHKYPLTKQRREIIPSVPFDIRVTGPPELDSLKAKIGWKTTEKKTFRQQGTFGWTSSLVLDGNVCTAVMCDVRIPYKLRSEDGLVTITASVRSNRVLAASGETACAIGDLKNYVCFCCQQVGGQSDRTKMSLQRDTADESSYAQNSALDPKYATCGLCMRCWINCRIPQTVTPELRSLLVERLPLCFGPRPENDPEANAEQDTMPTIPLPKLEEIHATSRVSLTALRALPTTDQRLQFTTADLCRTGPVLLSADTAMALDLQKTLDQSFFDFDASGLCESGQDAHIVPQVQAQSSMSDDSLLSSNDELASMLASFLPTDDDCSSATYSWLPLDPNEFTLGAPLAGTVSTA